MPGTLKFNAPPKPRYWGPDLATQGLYDVYYNKQLQDAERQYAMEYFDRYGYFPGQQQEVGAAQGAAEAEYQQLIQELQSAINNVGADPFSQSVRDYYMNAMSGESDPFDERTIAALISQESDPLFAAAANQQSRLRSSFAARGLGRTGGLGSLEQRIMQDAIAEANRAGGRIRSQAQLGNADFRRQAAAGGGQFFQGLSAQRNALIGQLANIRSQKRFDPSYFRGGRNSGYQTAGSDFQYTPPPPPNSTAQGTSAPRF